MAEELDPLLQTHVKAVSFSRLKSYPTPQDFPGAIGGGAPHLVFLDVFSNRDQAVVLIEEMVKLGPQVQGSSSAPRSRSSLCWVKMIRTWSCDASGRAPWIS